MQNLEFEQATVYYYEKYLSQETAMGIFTTISELFDSEENKMICNENNEPIYKLNRKTIVFIDSSIDNAIIPKIWGNNVTILEFPKELINIKSDLEKLLNLEDNKFNICLTNYYIDGKKSIGWHSDNEEKGNTDCIASISLGAEREFMFRKKNSKDIYKKILLHNGSLIIMAEGCQENYQHSLPINKLCKDPRLNLTFRFFNNDKYINY